MLPIPDIAASIRASRSEFGRLFLQAQVDFVADPSRRTAFEAVGFSTVDKEAYEAALRYAEANGWLAPVVNALVEEGLEDGRITESMVMSAKGERAAELQAMTNRMQGFSNPALIYRGIANGMRWTVKVLVDGNAKGTGILIGPHLVLTAWHVVSALFSAAATGGYEPAPGAASRLQVEFDDFLTLVNAGAVAPNTTLRVPAHENWCVIFSQCHTEELNARLPADLGELEGMWDYAVIRLAKCPGTERRWASLDARAVVPKATAQIIVFQHPAGQPLKTDLADIVAPAAGETTAIPRLRFLHAANAVGGSSGGPCFDKTFMLFGLHQGVWTRQADHGPINRGVPIQRVMEDYKEKIKDLPVPDPSDNPIWHLGSAEFNAPVIGCDVFQTMVWRSAIVGSPRVISIHGDPCTGKTFRLAVLSAMLPDGSHLKIQLDAAAISKLNAVELAQAICKLAGVAQLPAFSSIAEFASTPATWLRNEVLLKLMASLDSVRAGRLIWLTLADLNKTDIQGENASALLLLIYDQTRTREWLRIVLDGMKGDLPAAIRLLSQREDVFSPGVNDMKVYVRRAVAEMAQQLPDESVVNYASKQAMKDYLVWRANEPSNAMTLLSERAMSIVQICLEDIVAGGH